MITDAIIAFFAGIIEFLVNLLPEAPIVALGNGAASGTACCAVFLIDAVTTVTTSITSGTTGGLASIANSPIALLIDLYYLGFVVGCLVSVGAAFIIFRILLIMWQQVKW